MFDALRPQAPDMILRLMQMFRDDPRGGKVDLGVGVYRDATGRTPVMRAVREAGRRMWAAEETKVYTAMPGDPAFLDAMRRLVLGPDTGAAIATPGGTGALRQAFELIRLARPDATIWLPDPTWPNHPALISAVGLRQATYRYFDTATGGLDVDGMMADLERVAAGDVILLHGCCHNPTGADLRPAHWAHVARILAHRGALPLIDMAYQGFGEGVEDDALPTRRLVTQVPEALIAASCSKNFGIYRERTGVLIATGGGDVVQDNLTALNRLAYSFPPDHGARLVATVLTSADLEADWRAELDGIRRGMVALREALAVALRAECRSDRFGFVAEHRGMFSRLGLSPAEVEALRDRHGIYMLGDSRMNVAGLTADTVPVLARAIAQVTA
ncbi:aromatic amino acid transaminase [Falsirhodobacter halotolerans]|uniref:amino acid aminotransferase n=1 Tax=Falsirhodobacter halotolerans TaxID=1146892 RepID=UPI001FD04A85|nr:amino acid aminotransferase [Falsirhodobacter halotolerans]MCJ8140672.1 aspartate/tyrosine/aromatic aminotransferase [Falsirhodobacter halotolerans]